MNFAIIGCGNISKRHAEHIQTVGKLVAVCGIIESKAKELAEKYNADFFTSIEELFISKKIISFYKLMQNNIFFIENDERGI